MKPLRLVLWIVLALAQLAVPAWMIVGEERVLRDGRQLKLHEWLHSLTSLCRFKFAATSSIAGGVDFAARALTSMRSDFGRVGGEVETTVARAHPLASESQRELIAFVRPPN